MLIDNFDNYNIDDLIGISHKYNANICGLNIQLISSDIISKIKDNNLLITVYSDKNINLDTAKECFNFGVDSIFIDDPLEFKELF